MLARAAGTSTSVRAERFQLLVGSSPMQTMAQWRMLLATNLLCRSNAPLARIAEEVRNQTDPALRARDFAPGLRSTAGPAAVNGRAWTAACCSARCRCPLWRSAGGAGSHRPVATRCRTWAGLNRRRKPSRYWTCGGALACAARRFSDFRKCGGSLRPSHETSGLSNTAQPPASCRVSCAHKRQATA